MAVVISVYGKSDMRQIEKAEKSLKSMKREVASQGGAWSKMGAAASGAKSRIATIGAAAGLTALTGMAYKGVKAYQDLTSSISALQRQSDISAEDASLLVGQWQRYGVAVESGTKATTILSKSIYAINTAAAGSEKAAGAFDALGISLEDLKTKTPAEVLEQVRAALSEMPPSAERTALASTLLGRGFQSMSKWIGASSDDLSALNQQLRDTGQVMSKDELSKAKDDMKQMALLQVQWRGLQVELGRAALPYMTSFASATSAVLRVATPLAPALKYVVIALAGFIVVSKIAAGLNAMTTSLKVLTGAASRARTSLSGRYGAAGGSTPGMKPGSSTAQPLAAAEGRNTAAVNRNTAAQQRAASASTRSAAASNRETAADTKSATASSMAASADRRQAAASTTAAGRTSLFGRRAQTGSVQVGGLGTKSQAAGGKMSKLGAAMGGTAGTVALMMGLGVALTFTMNKLAELSSAIDQASAAAGQAEGARSDAVRNAKAFLEHTGEKYGKDSEQYRKALAIYKQALKDIARDAYKKPWWMKAGEGANKAWKFAFGGGQASGGDYMVTRPTLFLAGEAGPERATFTPQGKSAPAGRSTPIVIQIENLWGTDGAAATAFGNKVAGIVAHRLRMAEASGF